MQTPFTRKHLPLATLTSPFTSSAYPGFEVSMPTLPLLSIVKSVEVAHCEVDEAIVTTDMPLAPVVVGEMNIETRPAVVEVPMATLPPLFMRKYVADDEPMANAGPVMPFGFIENCAHGVLDPTPTRPFVDLLESDKIGVFVVDVPKLSAWSTPFCNMMSALLLPNVILPSESIVVVEVPPKYAVPADICVVEALP